VVSLLSLHVNLHSGVSHSELGQYTRVGHSINSTVTLLSMMNKLVITSRYIFVFYPGTGNIYQSNFIVLLLGPLIGSMCCRLKTSLGV
jgi:hypothetical protein